MSYLPLVRYSQFLPASSQESLAVWSDSALSPPVLPLLLVAWLTKLQLLSPFLSAHVSPFLPVYRSGYSPVLPSVPTGSEHSIVSFHPQSQHMTSYLPVTVPY